jgi:transposase
MEELLELYQAEPRQGEAVWSFDERPCVLHDDCIAPLPMKPKASKREDYTYKRNGTASLLMAYNIHTGERVAQIRKHRTANDYAEFMQSLADRQPGIHRIHLMEDNLNTHKNGSFYTAFSAHEARRLATLFEHHYTPKHASWLNIIELDFSALSRQCLDRRIGTIEELEREVLAWVEKRNISGACIQWQCTLPKARQKFQRFYHTVCDQNPQALSDDWVLRI